MWDSLFIYIMRQLLAIQEEIPHQPHYSPCHHRFLHQIGTHFHPTPHQIGAYQYCNRDATLSGSCGKRTPTTARSTTQCKILGTTLLHQIGALSHRSGDIIRSGSSGRWKALMQTTSVTKVEMKTISLRKTVDLDLQITKIPGEKTPLNLKMKMIRGLVCCRIPVVSNTSWLFPYILASYLVNPKHWAPAYQHAATLKTRDNPSRIP